jgi:putative PEP-CTERM system integral membrane protein
LLVRGLSKQIQSGDLTKLDSIHAIAKTYKIVTPFSSAIVLVNDKQRELLRKAEAQADRFDRKFEDGKESLNKPNNPLNVARIPEPSPIVGLIAIALFFEKISN